MNKTFSLYSTLRKTTGERDGETEERQKDGGVDEGMRRIENEKG